MAGRRIIKEWGRGWNRWIANFRLSIADLEHREFARKLSAAIQLSQKAFGDNRDRLGAGAFSGRGIRAILLRAEIRLGRGECRFERSELLLEGSDSRFKRSEIGNRWRRTGRGLLCRRA